MDEETKFLELFMLFNRLPLTVKPPLLIGWLKWRHRLTKRGYRREHEASRRKQEFHTPAATWSRYSLLPASLSVSLWVLQKSLAVVKEPEGGTKTKDNKLLFVTLLSCLSSGTLVTLLDAIDFKEATYDLSSVYLKLTLRGKDFINKDLIPKVVSLLDSTSFHHVFITTCHLLQQILWMTV